MRRKREEEGRDHVVCRLCGRDFSVVNWPHLVGRHGFDPEDILRDYHARFPGVPHISRATVRSMARAQYKRYEGLGRRWSDDRILRTIRRACRDRGRPPTVNEIDPNLRSAARRRYGGWIAALGAAGIRHPYGRDGWDWTRERIVREIRQRAASGEPLRFGAVYRHRAGLVRAAKRGFGSWSAAVRAAGHSRALPRPLRHWTRPDLLGLLLRTVRRHGYVSGQLLRKEKRAGFVSPHWAVSRLFGSLKRALKAAGISCPGTPLWFKWSPARIVEAIRLRARRGRALNAAAIQREIGSLYHAGVRTFGSWKATLSASSVEPERIFRR